MSNAQQDTPARKVLSDKFYVVLYKCQLTSARIKGMQHFVRRVQSFKAFLSICSNQNKL